MTKTALGMSVGGIALLVGFAVGYAAGRSNRIQFNPIVIVGPDAGILTPKGAVTLHCLTNDQMTWRSDNGQSLVISFPVDKFPAEAQGNEPFQDMKKVVGSHGDEWVFIHPFGTNVVVSPKINPKVCALAQNNPRGLNYAYDQTLGGTRADGRIIIMK